MKISAFHSVLATKSGIYKSLFSIENQLVALFSFKLRIINYELRLFRHDCHSSLVTKLLTPKNMYYEKNLQQKKSC